MSNRVKAFEAWLQEVVKDSEKFRNPPPPPDDRKVGTESFYFWLGKDAEE